MASTFDTRDYGYVKTDNIFGGQAPTPTWDSTSDFGVNYGGVPSYDWGSTSGMNTGLINNLSYGGGTNSSGPNWLGKGLEALNKALAYKGQSGSSSGSRSYRGYGSNAPTAVQGRGYTMFMPTPTQKTTQSGGSRGIGGALGTIAGIGVSMIPGVGQAAAAAAPALGGTLGGFFG
jgi:hypothetical protein